MPSVITHKKIIYENSVRSFYSIIITWWYERGSWKMFNFEIYARSFSLSFASAFFNAFLFGSEGDKSLPLAPSSAKPVHHESFFND